MDLFVFHALSASAWWRQLDALSRALQAEQMEAAQQSYVALYRVLAERGAPDLLTAVAEDLLWEGSSLADAALRREELPPGLRAGAVSDVETLRCLLRRDWQAEVTKVLEISLPSLCQLASPVCHADVKDMLKVLQNAPADEVVTYLLTHYRRRGTGMLAKHEAFRWADGKLHPIAYPAHGDLEGLVSLSRQLAQLRHNTEGFLAGRPAQDTLLYGPRGSGKSTAVRGLLKLYAEAGLRLLELSPADLSDLPRIIELLRFSPHRYILFVDDLSFELGDTRCQPLKTLLEGSLVMRPENVLVYATSNRRHLLSERFADRPDPLNDDVHAWDTHNEHLALADRFGLTLTFPSATQQRYLEIVRGLATQENVACEGLDAQAIRFAEWGNGYSGRTARQFVDGLKAS